MFSLISQERLHQFSSLRCLWIFSSSPIEWCCPFENQWSRSRDINEKPFRTKHVFINISGTALPNFKFKVSMDLCHQVRLNGVVLLKIDGAIHE